jgi:HPt (histidine-containing phosphotransfer) domain-containing protein
MAEIQEAVTLSDAQNLERAAHKLKGAAAVFDARSVVEAAEQLEILGRQRNLSAAGNAFPFRSPDRGADSRFAGIAGF